MAKKTNFGIYQDFWAVYHKKLRFLKNVDEKDIFIRTSTETRTSQVAGGLLFGMDSSSVRGSFKVHNQPGNARTIEPIL
jgi:hypothetical protein